MRTKNILLIAVVMAGLFSIGCKSANKAQKGVVIGAVGGAAAGAIIGKAAGNAGLGAIIGATVGGVTGGIIGNKMDKQAEEIAKNVPDAKVVRVGEGIVIELNSKILFGFDQSALTTESKVGLDKLIGILQKYPDTDIEIQGHTDSKGTVRYNQALSERRASAVSAYLSGAGVQTSRIVISTARLTTVGFGETLPKYSNETADGQSQNRRVEFLITANEKMKADAAKESEAGK